MLTAALTLLTGNALAGGIGLMATGGVHGEPLYYYSSVDENGIEFTDPSQYDQFKVMQTLPNLGGGLEFLLGDRDDRILGVTRFYYLMDSPQIDPTAADDNRPDDTLVVAYREGARHIGVGMIGLNWGIVGDPNKFQFGLGTHIGAAFMTNDYSDFLLLSGGPTLTYRLNRQVQVYGELAYQARFRFDIQHSADANLGVRYFFD